MTALKWKGAQTAMVADASWTDSETGLRPQYEIRGGWLYAVACCIPTRTFPQPCRWIGEGIKTLDEAKAVAGRDDRRMAGGAP
jgi:hypothetical protein